jgi:predicted unusual protein kinase regulating ubiquinone biosynthesis (AarF/ABC1/UbiB family)
MPEFRLKWLVDEFNRNLPMELNFYTEANNTARVRENFEGVSYFHVPETVWVTFFFPSINITVPLSLYNTIYRN